jgi:alpha-glucosidase
VPAPKSIHLNAIFLPLLALVLLYACPRAAIAEPDWQPIGTVTAAAPLPNGVELTTAVARIRVEALGPSVIRVRCVKDGLPAHEDPFAVVSDPGFVSPHTHLDESPDAYEFTTGEVVVRILKSNARVIFLNPAGDVIAQDAPDGPASWNGRAFRVRKSMPDDEHYFGLGDKAGPIDHRNQAFTMWNTDAIDWKEFTDPLYKSIPFFLAMRRGSAYGIFLDNTYRTSFDFGKESRGVYSFGAEDGPLDYYFFYGPRPKKVVENYTALTGRTPLPPRFSLGYQQSRWSYPSESRVREIARQFRTRKIPADVIYLDIDYQDGNRPFTIDRKNFPQFENMIRDLRREGFKVIAITDCHLKQEPGYKPYDEGIAGGYFVKNSDGGVYIGSVWPGPSAFPDFADPDARAWWGTLYTEFAGMGIRGFWNDMNEPAVFDGPGKTMPRDVAHRVDGRETTHREIHNVYGMENARATYEGLSRLEPNVRPFVLTRAAFAGTQRFAATWTGDNSSTWDHLRLTVSTLLSLGISGYAFAGADIGGFKGNPSPELLTRWMELGAFLPMYRNHAIKGSADREPWVDGPEHEAIRRRYIEARYELLPYIYTVMEEASRTGVPMMRPMFMEFPDDETLTTNSEEFMVGEDLLVAPDLAKSPEPFKATLPRGKWYDYRTGESVEGGKDFTLSPALGELPVFVKGGAILPLEHVIQNTGEVPHGPLELRVYPGPNCGGSIYTDDGESFAYRRGSFLRENFTCRLEPHFLEINVSAAQGSYTPWWKTMEFEIFGFDSAPKQVRVGSRIVKDWSFDSAHRKLIVVRPAEDRGLNLQIAY